MTIQLEQNQDGTMRKVAATNADMSFEVMPTQVSKLTLTERDTETVHVLDVSNTAGSVSYMKYPSDPARNMWGAHPSERGA